VHPRRPRGRTRVAISSRTVLVLLTPFGLRTRAVPRSALPGWTRSASAPAR